MSMPLTNPYLYLIHYFRGFTWLGRQVGLPTILEDDATSEYESDKQSTKQKHNSLDNIHPITTQFANIPNITEPVSTTATGESNPHTNGDELPPIFSQTQTEIGNSYLYSYDEEIPITVSSEVPQFDEIAK